MTESQECNEAPCESSDLESGLEKSNVASDTCHLTYLKIADRHARGGVAAPEDNQGSLDSCQEVCNQLMTCQGVDWDEGDNPWKGIRCWLKNIEFDANEGLNHYQRLDWTNDNLSAFMKYLNYHAEGGEPHINATTPEECANVCIPMPECVSFDFDTNENPWKDTRCWVHRHEIESWSDGHHWIKQPCALPPDAVEPEVEPAVEP